MVSVNEVLKSILNRFESGDLPEAIAYSTFPALDIPLAGWSLLNRTLVYVAGTSDARGFRQWQAVNRRVRKGAKAIYILVPRIVHPGKDDVEENHVLTGFLAKPVFRLEDTEGDPVQYSTPTLPEFPFIAKAEEWSISVKAVSGNNNYYGYFSESGREIGLASREESVFYHELAHAACARLREKKEPREEWVEEIVAELTAAVLCNLVGKKSKYLGNHYRYIEHYARQAKLTPIQACLKTIREVEKVLELIMMKSESAEPPCPS